jgi:hypothetical protein
MPAEAAFNKFEIIGSPTKGHHPNGILLELFIEGYPLVNQVD